MEEIRRDRIFYDESGGGVTFSGGEPLSQPEFLASLLRACRIDGIHTALDTSGYSEKKVFLETASLASLVLYDLKVMDPETHLRLTGVYNKGILENIRALSVLGPEILIRIPLVPDVNDSEANIIQTGDFARGLPNISGVELLPFHPMAREKHQRFSMPYEGPDPGKYPEERIENAAGILSRMGLNVIRRDL
jgi:pyruvate formate lyase activating enzyme